MFNQVYNILTACSVQQQQVQPMIYLIQNKGFNEAERVESTVP